MRLAASVILLAVLLVLAGCMGKQQRPPFDQVDADVRAAAMPLLVQDHGAPGGHYDAAAHRGSLNLEMVAHHNGVDETGDPDRIPAGGYYTELDIEGDYVYLARHSVDGSSGGFVILDISDVRAGGTTIRKVGEFVAQGGADIEVTPEGGDGTQYAFFATQRNTIEQLATGVVASGDPAAQAPRGIHIVDISDRVAPQARGFYPLPYNGPHTITYHRHANGQEYVIASTYDFLGNTVPSSTTPSLPLPFQVVPVTQKVLVLQFLRPPPGTSVPALLAPVNQFQITQRAPEGMVYFPHDTYVEGPTAARNQTLLYVSYWDKGLRIVDFSDPAKAPLPELQGFTEFGPSSLNAIHFARPFDEPIAGLHVTVTEPEVVAADETGQITFLDTTDLSRPPQKLGHWKLPPGHSGDLFVSNLDFSPHNFDVWDGKVALAHYHAGLWVIDVSDEDNLRSPRSVAFTMEVKERQDNTRMQPWFWGVLEHDGLLYASDEGTGLYVYRYTGP